MVEDIARILSEAGMDPSRLRVEVSECTGLEDSGRVQNLEQVELDVADVALVMAQGNALRGMSTRFFVS